MNLRNADTYDIGLDIGTGSVGWSVTTVNGEPLHFKGKPTLGSRLFDSAKPASEARMKREQRRRYVRRRWRLNLLQSLFTEEMERVDPEFFIRLNQSRLLAEDRSEDHGNYTWPLFNEKDFKEPDYYKKFPTIYHLRKWLMETDERADIRLIYLAFHNIVKTRGNFLRQGERISSKDTDMARVVKDFCDSLEDWCDSNDIVLKPKPNREAIITALEQSGVSRSSRQAEIAKALGFDKDDEKQGKEIAKAIVGLKADMTIVFGIEGEGLKFEISNEEKVDEFEQQYCPDEGLPLFESILSVYSSFMLNGILSMAPGQSISNNKVKEYEQYGEDLRRLKQLVRDYVPLEYDDFFRGELYPDKSGYNASKAKGYTKYNLVRSGTSYDELKRSIIKLFENTDAVNKFEYQEMESKLKEGSFLRRLKTTDNGSIPYQLHLEELNAIIDNQKKHHPFLEKERMKLNSLVEFRIPYYVGPLTTLNAPKKAAKLGNAQSEQYRFAWSVRKEGKRYAKVYPWNWDEIIDRGASAEAFINRMTGTCTYLLGEPVLPRNSLLYEEFCVLNELNGAHWDEGDRKYRFDLHERRGIIADLFLRKQRVTYKDVENWLKNDGGHIVPHVEGGQGETAFESKLSAHIFFAKDILKVEVIPLSDYPMIEEIILWNTLFEDRTILREKVKEKYGNRLDDKQIKSICKKRFSGWGRLSEKLLMGLKAKTDRGLRSIIEIMRDGDPNADKLGRSMVFMEILHDEKLGFQKLIDQENEVYESTVGLSIDELPGSPALRRGINQALSLVKEIVGIAGKTPRTIFVESAREEDPRNKNRRTRRRYNQLKDALETFKKEDPDLWQELSKTNPNDLDERLTLYFMQRGKSLYSGRPLDINNLHDTGIYEVDHILPRSYIKDDSFENKALVFRPENQRKADSLLLDDSIRKQCSRYWRSLHDAGLIGNKKYINLMKTKVGDNELKGFINRQLVETRQIIKLVQQMLNKIYPETKVVPIKAEITSELRTKCDFVKCREANNFHHAHDAFLASQIGRFILKRHPMLIDDPIKTASIMRSYIRSQGNSLVYGKNYLGSSSFVVGSFLTPGFDQDTGEVFKDDWNPEVEISMIRKCLNYRDCYITHMPVEDTGYYWDSTIYSPRSNVTMNLPLKKGLDPKKYGSYSSEQFSYFYIYAAKDKKGNLVNVFDQVPVRVSIKRDFGLADLEEYARAQADQNGLSFHHIVRERILKNQVIEFDGNRVAITGVARVSNVVEIAFSQSQLKILDMLSNDKCDDLSAVDDLMSYVIDKFKKLAPRTWDDLHITDDNISKFYNLTIKDKKTVLFNIISCFNGKNSGVDLTMIGRVKSSGNNKIRFNKLLKTTSVTIVDQSITGMFERRTDLGL